MVAVYWLVTRPVNQVWVEAQAMSRSGATFFPIGANGATIDASHRQALRDRWEHSHVARAVLAVISVLAMAISLRVSSV